MMIKYIDDITDTEWKVVTLDKLKYIIFKAKSNGKALIRQVKEDKIIGEYSGYSSVFLGLFVLFMQSNIGIISLVLGIGMVAIFEIYQQKVDVVINKRKDEILETL